MVDILFSHRNKFLLMLLSKVTAQGFPLTSLLTTDLESSLA